MIKNHQYVQVNYAKVIFEAPQADYNSLEKGEDVAKHF